MASPVQPGETGGLNGPWIPQISSNVVPHIIPTEFPIWMPYSFICMIQANNPNTWHWSWALCVQWRAFFKGSIWASMLVRGGGLADRIYEMCERFLETFRLALWMLNCCSQTSTGFVSGWTKHTDNWLLFWTVALDHCDTVDLPLHSWVYRVFQEASHWSLMILNVFNWNIKKDDARVLLLLKMGGLQGGIPLPFQTIAEPVSRHQNKFSNWT